MIPFTSLADLFSGITPTIVLFACTNLNHPPREGRRGGRLRCSTLTASLHLGQPVEATTREDSLQKVTIDLTVTTRSVVTFETHSFVRPPNYWYGFQPIKVPQSHSSLGTPPFEIFAPVHFTRLDPYPTLSYPHLCPVFISRQHSPLSYLQTRRVQLDTSQTHPHTARDRSLV
jgi:hypothetical protein